MKIKDKVELLLKRKDTIGVLCRNNDNFLVLYYIEQYHKDLRINYEKEISLKSLSEWAVKLPALSEFKRIRADFQNKKGLYKAELKTTNKRRQQEENKRKEYSK